MPARRKIRKPRHAIPKMAFRRLVEEIAAGFKSDLRFQPDGLDALQESAETVLTEHFERCAQVAGLCKVATLKEIEAQGWSLNPGRYVGVTERGEDDFDFAEKLEELNEELEVLNQEARELEER